MAVYQTSIQDWLQGPSGRRLRESERAVAAERLRRIYGLQFLQVGRWGSAGDFLSFPATARRAMCDAAPGVGVDFVANPAQLPVTSHSVDALFLPHTLELSADPHQVLREADRVITEGGRLVIMGFNPLSTVGVRRILSRGAWPPGLAHLYSEGRIRDWLSLLNFDVTDVRYFRMTTERQQRRWRFSRLEGVYLLTAVKRVFVVTPMRRLWRRPARVGARVAEPSTRNTLGRNGL
jgi:SAM-dependent methyltransferase